MDFSSIFNTIKNLGILALIIFSVICILAYLFQDKILYLPVVQGLSLSPKDNPPGYRTPADRGLDYSDVHITTSDNLRLHGWFIKQKDSKNVPTVLYFHENAGNIGTRIPYMEEYYRSVGANVMLIAYRGYSNSEGVPTEKGLQLDAEATMKHLFNRDDIDTSRIYLHGRSLGGAVAIYCGANLKQYKYAGIIAEITFTSISDMVDVVMPQLSIGILKSLLIKNHWRSIDIIDKINVPMHFIFAMQDELVPPAHMAKLYEKATTVKTKYVVKEGSHNNNWSVDPEHYFQSVSNFITSTNQQ